MDLISAAKGRADKLSCHISFCMTAVAFGNAVRSSSIAGAK